MAAGKGPPGTGEALTDWAMSPRGFGDAWKLEPRVFRRQS